MDSFIGNTKIIEFFRRSFENNSFFHANLFLGPGAIGKRTLALAIARSIKCSAKKFGGCGSCAICRHIDIGVHPDLFYINCPKDKKNISVEQVRELRSKLNQGSWLPGQTIAIIDDAHTLSLGAANAILKKLEESEKTIFFLLCETIETVPETIASRCFVFNWEPVPDSELPCGADLKKLTLGRPGRMRLFQRDREAQKLAENLYGEVDRLFRSGTSEGFAFLDVFFGKKVFTEQQNKARELFECFADIVRRRLRANPEKKYNQIIGNLIKLEHSLDEDINPRILFEQFILSI